MEKTTAPETTACKNELAIIALFCTEPVLLPDGKLSDPVGDRKLQELARQFYGK